MFVGEEGSTFCGPLGNTIIEYKMSLTNEKCLVYAPLGGIGSFLSACQNPSHQGCPVVSSCPTKTIWEAIKYWIIIFDYGVSRNCT